MQGIPCVCEIPVGFAEVQFEVAQGMALVLGCCEITSFAAPA